MFTSLRRVGLWLLKVSCSCCEHTTDCQGRGPVGGVCSPLGCAAPAWSPRWYTPVRVWRGSGGLLEGSAVQLAVQPRRRSVPIWAACVWWVLRLVGAVLLVPLPRAAQRAAPRRWLMHDDRGVQRRGLSPGTARVPLVPRRASPARCSHLRLHESNDALVALMRSPATRPFVPGRAPLP